MIYFDNGATSYPKPYGVITKTLDALKNYSFNSGRGGYYQSLKAAEKIYSVRNLIGEMFAFESENIIFTKNCSEALNMAIKGSVSKGDHVIISSLEHNSVFRVVHSLFLDDIIDYDIAAFSFDEDEAVRNFESLIRDNTKTIICMHSSNVFGVTFPIEKIGKLCKKHDIRFIVDGAQGAGVADIKANRDNIDILCCAGHKCLLGPMGSGFMALKEGVKLKPLFDGGTGSNSLSPVSPEFSPDRYEVGTLNNLGIIGLGEGIKYINNIGTENIYNHELKLSSYLYDELSKMKNVELYAPKPEKNKSMPIISFNINDFSSEKTAAILAEHNICTRAGYHCSYLAHRHFNTIKRGTVRISVGPFNSEKDCYRFMNVVKKL
ncbi:MAG: aminotransferase class V-fold PLP-dependent enzyme [Eubacterium sp.]|nr:aminotransferase class V-fold PLP-dependent enzyme [Eubacterium sp.]